MKLGATLAALTLSIGVASFSAAIAQPSSPPTPRPAAGALPQPNPNAVQKTFRSQTKEEQQTTSNNTSPVDLGQSGRTRSSK
jgi:hypothetical protein